MLFKNRILMYNALVLILFVTLIMLMSLNVIKEHSESQFLSIKESIVSYNKKLLTTFIQSQNSNLSKEIKLINIEAKYLAYTFEHVSMKKVKTNNVWISDTLSEVFENRPKYIKAIEYIDISSDIIHRFDDNGYKTNPFKFIRSNFLEKQKLYVVRDDNSHNIKRVYFYEQLTNIKQGVIAIDIELNQFIESLGIQNLDDNFDFTYFLMDENINLITSNPEEFSDNKVMNNYLYNLNEDIKEKIKDKKTGVISIEINECLYNLTFNVNYKTGWYVFLVTPESVINSSYSSIKSYLLSSDDKLINYFILLILTLLFVFLFINSMVMKNLISPMNKLILQARALRDQKYDKAMIKIENKGDEIEGLSYVFSEASSTIKTLIEDLEKKVEERTLQLEKVSQKANEANKKKTIFLSNVSHEIRTPLNAIIGYTEILKENNGIGNKNNRYFNGISNASHTILCLVNDLLDLERIKTDNYELKYKKVKLIKILKDIESIFLPLSIEKGLLLTINTDDVPNSLDIIIDELRFKQALSNLISNAIKFTYTGYVKLEVDINQSDSVLFKVIDTGIGIPEHQLLNIFKNREQVNVEDQQEGFGLGLAITNTILTLMKGNLFVESKLDQGSIFTIELPKETVVNDISYPLFNIEEKRCAKKDFSNLRALVVDDVEFNREILQFQLESFDIKCTLAESGIEAISAIEISDFDIIFTDISMPIMDGVELSKTLKSMNIHTPIIAVTARATVQEESKMNDFFDYYITKPIDKHQILSGLCCALDM
ncbi:ATP-binding protein [Aliivibrio finisterrensis]|uniref:histidine kinase n=1 Tax=Aliivibrio finisterrensis TaxID=511998 RepID=A0A4Q5L052_9GAMM|nr:ATP-binding protein [Aliivibrio finisterrensis]RYU54750.1 response regulator [Aliivibrio finisterrensis]